MSEDKSCFFCGSKCEIYPAPHMRSVKDYRCKYCGSYLIDEDFVFSWPDGRPLEPDVVNKAFHRIVRKAGITNIRLHDLRHTHATLMLKGGGTPQGGVRASRTRKNRHNA